MGVNHLSRDAAAVASGAYHENTGKSRQSVTLPQGAEAKRPAETSGTTSVPKDAAVNAMGNNITRPGNSAPYPTRSGGPMGAKSGLGKMGQQSGNKKGMSGGRMG